MSDTAAYLISGGLVLAGGIVLAVGFHKLRRYRLIADTPTSKVRSMAMGVVEINGQARAIEKLVTPFSDTPCIYYRYEIKEYRRHTSRDSKGRTTTSYRWDTVRTGNQSTPFYCEDDTGKVWVDPDGADFMISQHRIFYQRAGFMGSFTRIIEAFKNWDRTKTDLLDRKGWELEEVTGDSFISFGSTVGDRKYYEYFILPDDTLYVLGSAASRDGAPGGVYICKGDNEKTYIISDSSEKGLLSKIRNGVILSFVFSVAAITGGILLFLKFTRNL